MVGNAISGVCGRISMQLMHNTAIEMVWIVTMSDFHFLYGEVMFVGVFWRRKWWWQFNSCV